MANKGYISEFMSGGRISSHGKITDLSQGFKLPNGLPFTIYVRPKYDTQEVDVVINVKLYQEEDFSPAPVIFYDWSPMAVEEIAPDKDLLKNNDVYWGCGQSVEP